MMDWEKDRMQVKGSMSEDDKLKRRFPLPEPRTVVYYYLQQRKQQPMDIRICILINIVGRDREARQTSLHTPDRTGDCASLCPPIL